MTIATAPSDRQTALKRNLPEPSSRPSARCAAPVWDPYKPLALGEKDRREASRSSPRSTGILRRRRVIYGLLPTAGLKNVGDHAQVVAIQRWIGKHYPGLPIIELDKNVILACRDEIVRMSATTIWCSCTAAAISATAASGRNGAAHPHRGAASTIASSACRRPSSSAKRRSATIRSRCRKPSMPGTGTLTVIGRDGVSGSLAKTLFRARK